MIRALLALTFFFVASTTFSAPDVRLIKVTTGLKTPIALTHAVDGSGRLFITEQDGRLMIYDGQRLLPKPFLDIRALTSKGGERGLLSAAFHPRYRDNGLFFVNYTDVRGDTVIARYKVSADRNVADPASARVLLQVVQPFANHNGGQLAFGPDGFLYIGMGDGGSGGDPGDRAQNLGTLLGKLLRIDVDAETYKVPPTNPFVGRAGALPEIWALGLRNPWRFSFDRLTGDLFIADVGQNQWEEIDLQKAGSGGGENYGWRLMEGAHCFNPSTNCDRGGLTAPIIEYNHTLGCSVTGGYRYRGMNHRQFDGLFFYGDFCSGRIWAASQKSDGSWKSDEVLDTRLLITSFGEDENGELYLLDYNTGDVYRLATPEKRRRGVR